MSDTAENFYDQLAEDYHFIFNNWDDSLAYQGNTINKIILSSLPNSKTLSILDCSCGIGTQSIGLAQKGHHVTATDISPASVERARKEANKYEVNICFGVSDFRTLNKNIKGTFDVVLSADNSIPHLLNEDDLRQTANQLYTKVRPGGMLIITMRNYKELLKEKPTSTKPRTFDGGNRIVFQLWDWKEDGRTYTLHHFIMQKTKGVWKTKQYSTSYRALLQTELTSFLQEAGFSNISWRSPEESGYYQPVLLAWK